MTDYIYTRIDELTEKCNSCISGGVYGEIIYEMDGLLRSLVGESHESYRNFIRIYRDSI